MSSMIDFPLFVLFFFYASHNGPFSFCFSQVWILPPLMVPDLAALSAFSFPGMPLCAGIQPIHTWHPRFLGLVGWVSISSLMPGLFPLVKFSSVSTDAYSVKDKVNLYLDHQEPLVLVVKS